MPSFKRCSPGDVVWGPDADHRRDSRLQGANMRPWLILSNDQFPGQGTHYRACALTHTPTPSLASMLPLAREDWEKGENPGSRSIDTETILTLRHDWIVKYSGRLRYGKLLEARKRNKSYLS